MNKESRRATVCFIRNEDKILLALIEYSPEKRIWNGIGGWAEIGESAEDAVVREAQEETFIILDKNNLKKVVEFDGGNNLHIFLCDQWSGELKIKEPSLKELRWFSSNELPYSQMFPGTEKWIPQVLLGKLLKGTRNGFMEIASFD